MYAQKEYLVSRRGVLYSLASYDVRYHVTMMVTMMVTMVTMRVTMVTMTVTMMVTMQQYVKTVINIVVKRSTDGQFWGIWSVKFVRWQHSATGAGRSNC